MTDPSGPAAAAVPLYRVLRFRDPHAALGHAVTQLMGKPGFARLPFGDWSRVLVGQINRGQYMFIARTTPDHRLVGFGGWSFASRAEAERWLAGQGDIPPRETAQAEAGREAGEADTVADCMIINAWQADDAAAQGFLLDQMRRAGRHVRMIYGRRSYPDGRVRMLRLPVLSRAVEGHLSRIRPDASHADTGSGNTAADG